MIVDDHPVVLDGLATALMDLKPQTSIYKAVDGGSAEALVNLHRDIDWIFMDFHLPDTNAIELMHSFEKMKLTAKTVVISSDSCPDMIDKVMSMNPCAFLSKSFSREELQECIETVEAGQIYLAPNLRRELNNHRRSILATRQKLLAQLSERQLSTLTLIAAGYSNKEIATSSNVAESTIKSRVKALLQIFDADNRTHCVFEARRLGVI